MVLAPIKVIIMSEIKIGEILLAQKLITAGQLEDALTRQKSLSPPPVLGKLLVRLGYVQEVQLQQILDRYEKRRSFAEVLLAHHYLSQEDLDVALEMSGNELLPLDRVLLNLDFIDSSGLGACIALNRDLAGKGGVLACAALNENVRKVFRMTRADQKILVFETRQEGVNALLERIVAARK